MELFNCREMGILLAVDPLLLLDYAFKIVNICCCSCYIGQSEAF